MTDLDGFDEYTPDWRKVERKRGILTKKDREYLVGDYQPEGQDERNTRYRIRQRIRQSLKDIILISYHLSDEDLRQIMDSKGMTSLQMRELLALAYRIQLQLLRITHAGERDEGFRTMNKYFEASIQAAVEEALEISRAEEADEAVTFTVNIDLSIHEERHDLEEIFQKLKGGSATEEEFETWLKHGDPETLRKYKEENDEPLKYIHPDLEKEVSCDITLDDMRRYNDETSDE